MEKEIQLHPENKYIKSDVAFDSTFVKIQREADWFKDIMSEYLKKNNLTTMAVINGRNIDGRDFSDMIIMHAYLENLDTKTKFKARALEMLDAFYNYENDEEYEMKVSNELKLLFGFEASAREKMKTLDCNNSSDLEYAVAMSRLTQCFGTKRSEFKDIIEKNYTVKDYRENDNTMLRTHAFCSTLTNEITTFQIDLEKYNYFRNFFGSKGPVFEPGTRIKRLFDLQNSAKNLHAEADDKIMFDIDTEEIYKYARLIKLQEKGKTTKEEDRDITDYMTDSVTYFSCLTPPGTNESHTADKLGLAWWDLVFVNGKSLHEIAGADKSNYELNRLCPKLFIDATINKNTIVDYVCLNSKGKDVEAIVKPIYINHDQKKYEKTFTFFEKVKNFFTGKLIKNLDESQKACHNSNKEVLNEFNRVIVGKVSDKFKEKGFNLVNEQKLSKQIDVNEVKNDININLDKKTDKTLDNVKVQSKDITK